MKKRCFSLVIIALYWALHSVSYSQNAGYQDIVELKSGSILKGVIVEQIPGENIRLKTGDGSIWVLKMDEISKIYKEFNNEHSGSPANSVTPSGDMVEICQEYFSEKITRKNQGRVKLIGFYKTNAVSKEKEGQKFYEMNFDLLVQVVQTVYADRMPFAIAPEFKMNTSNPADILVPVSPGVCYKFSGMVSLGLTENGWKVYEEKYFSMKEVSKVEQAKIMGNEPDLSGKGASASGGLQYLPSRDYYVSTGNPMMNTPGVQLIKIEFMKNECLSCPLEELAAIQNELRNFFRTCKRIEPGTEERFLEAKSSSVSINITITNFRSELKSGTTILSDKPYSGYAASCTIDYCVKLGDNPDPLRCFHYVVDAGNPQANDDRTKAFSLLIEKLLWTAEGVLYYHIPVSFQYVSTSKVDKAGNAKEILLKPSIQQPQHIMNRYFRFCILNSLARGAGQNTEIITPNIIAIYHFKKWEGGMIVAELITDKKSFLSVSAHPSEFFIVSDIDIVN